MFRAFPKADEGELSKRLADLVRDHVKVRPKSGREATTTFQQGQGDVLISYENEAIMLQRKNAGAVESSQVEYLIPPQTFKIENPVAVVNTSKDLPAAAPAKDAAPAEPEEEPDAEPVTEPEADEGPGGRHRID